LDRTDLGFTPWFRLRAQEEGGISTVSMMYTVALAVWTSPHTTCALLTADLSPDRTGGLLADL
jgi:hypothetical protein